MKRNDTLDLLRGVAILLVVALHASENFTARVPQFGEFAHRFGALGVQLFFIVSGYTMMLTFGPSVTPASLRAFYIRRVFRIAPLFWMAIPLYLALQGFGPRYWAPRGVSFADIAATSLFLQGFTPHAINSVVPGGWSIAAEMLFYALFPLFAYLFLTRRSSRLPYGLIVAVYGLGHAAKSLLLQRLFVNQLPLGDSYLVDSYFFFWLPNQIVAFGFGFALYQIVEKRTVPVVGLLLLFSLSLFSSFGLSVAALFVLALCLCRLGASNGVLARFGQASYAIYLIHFALLLGLKRASEAMGVGFAWEWTFPLTAALSLAIGARLIGPFLEAPILKFGRHCAAANPAKWPWNRASVLR